VAGGLSKLLQHEVNRICHHASHISDLLFADDTLLFMKVKEDQIEIINKVL
jgi:hypothetical protein